MTFDTREQSTYGGAPVELYEFTCGVLSWRYTSADVSSLPAVIGGDLPFVPAVISRGDIDQSDEDSQGSLEITVLRTCPVAQLFLPDLPAAPVKLTLWRMHRGDTDVIQSWAGEIAAVQFAGSTAKLTGIPVSRTLRRQVPGTTFQSQCNWVLFSPQCALAKASYKVVGTLTAVSGQTITAAAFGAHPDGYFNGGWVESLSGETHWIVQHVGNVLTLMTPFVAAAVGWTINAYPGCNRTIAACAAFGNLQHHCGFSFTPSNNPFVGGIF